MTAKPISYRDLRNTPGKVFEHLATGEPLELVADGATRALLIPVEDGDSATALDAWRRGRALLALARLQAATRREATAEFRCRTSPARSRGGSPLRPRPRNRDLS